MKVSGNIPRQQQFLLEGEYVCMYESMNAVSLP